MEPYILLAQLKGALSRSPSFDDYSPTSQLHHAWLGQAHALVNRWNTLEGASFRMTSDFLGSELTRNINLAKIFGTLNRAIADLELQLPATQGQAFGPGAIYDFFKALNSVISSAQTSLLIVDPYIDDTVFDAYLSGLPSGIAVRLLVEGYTAKVAPAVKKFSGQYNATIEARRSKEFHDRVIFVDASECWVLGQSIRKAAESKPTYLAPLSPDIAKLKLTHYENVWSQAQTI